MVKTWYNPYEQIPRICHNAAFYDIVLSCFTTEEIGYLSRLWKELEDDGA